MDYNSVLMGNNDHKNKKIILKEFLNHLKKDVKNFDLQQEKTDDFLSNIASAFYHPKKGEYQKTFDNVVNNDKSTKELFATPKNYFLSFFCSKVDTVTKEKESTR
jgi:hypothetical protein